MTLPSDPEINGARSRIGDKSGFVLPAMLSLTVLAALLLAGLLQSARSAHDGAADMARRTAAFYAAEAGVARASLAIADAIADRKAPPATARYSIDGQEVAVAISDLRARMDINGAPSDELRHLFERLGATGADAQSLADRIEKARADKSLTGIRDEALKDIAPASLSACLSRHLSAHGGQTSEAAVSGETPADFGAAVEITATTALAHEQFAEVQAVVRATGDPERPFLTHEWRRRVRGTPDPITTCWRDAA